MIDFSFADALGYIGSTTPGHWPHYFSPHWPHGSTPSRPIDSEEAWNAHQYNPSEYRLELYPDPDTSPDVRPKPTWDELRRAAKFWPLIRHGFGHAETVSYRLREPLAAVGNAPVGHSFAGSDVHVGGGVDHMGYLIHHRAASYGAGQEWPLAIMSEIEGGELQIWTGNEAAELLNLVASNRNRAESAANIVRARLAGLELIVYDEDGGLDPSATEDEKFEARETASNEWRAIVTDIAPHFHAALVHVDARASTLPTDVSRARAVLVARLSAYANRRRNRVIAVAEAADAYLPPACIEQDRATQAISAARQQGVIALHRAADIAGMENAYAIAIAALNRIQVLNTPIFQDLDGNSPPVDDGTDATIYEVDYEHVAADDEHDVVTVSAINPTSNLDGDRTVEELGHVAFTALEQERVNSRELWTLAMALVPNLPTTSQSAKLQYQGTGLPPEVSDVMLVARNNCGPAALHVRVRTVPPDVSLRELTVRVGFVAYGIDLGSDQPFQVAVPQGEQNTVFINAVPRDSRARATVVGADENGEGTLHPSLTTRIAVEVLGKDGFTTRTYIVEVAQT